ncbi:MAG: histidinol-phosphate transaminase [Pseudomonadota bacterium]
MNSNPFLDAAAPGIPGLAPYVPGKPVEELERELGIADSVKLASNENPLGPSPLGVRAAREATSTIHLYPDDTAFRLRKRLARLHGVQPGQLIFGSGSSDILAMVAQTFLHPGVNAVYAAHSFAMYAIYTQAAAAEGRVAPALAADHPLQPYGHDLDAMLSLVDGNTRVIYIANPNNPTGTWLAAADLKTFIERVPEQVVVVLDEAYTQYVQEPEFPDGIPWIAEHPNLLVTRTFSKIYGLAGLRVGYGMGNPELLEVIARVRHPFNVGSIALAAAEAALEDESFIQRSVQTNRVGLEELMAGCAALGLDTIPSVGNFLCVAFDRPGRAVYEELLRQAVIVRPVDNYGLPNHLRITVGTAAENQRLLEALRVVLGR